MKFTSAIVFCVLATSAFGASYAGQQVSPAPAPYIAPNSAPAQYESPTQSQEGMEKCWMETKKCCWVEKDDGYECRDHYDTKMARCYKKYKWDRKCDKAEKHGQMEKPESRVDYGKCEKVQYDPNYGPHVAGYPTGVSETYHSKELPTTPYKVEAKPHARHRAPNTSYEQNGQNTANKGYTAPPAAGGY